MTLLGDGGYYKGNILRFCFLSGTGSRLFLDGGMTKLGGDRRDIESKIYIYVLLNGSGSLLFLDAGMTAKKEDLHLNLHKRYKIMKGSCPSGQWDQTVNLTAEAFVGSNPTLPTNPLLFYLK